MLKETIKEMIIGAVIAIVITILSILTLSCYIVVFTKEIKILLYFPLVALVYCAIYSVYHFGKEN